MMIYGVFFIPLPFFRAISSPKILIMFHFMRKKHCFSSFYAQNHDKLQGKMKKVLFYASAN